MSWRQFRGWGSAATPLSDPPSSQQRHCQIPQTRSNATVRSPKLTFIQQQFINHRTVRNKQFVVVSVSQWRRFVLQSVSHSVSQTVTGTGVINFQVIAAGFYADGGRIFGCYVVQYSCSLPTFQSYHCLHLRKGQLQRFRRGGKGVWKCVGYVAIHAFPQMTVRWGVYLN